MRKQKFYIFLKGIIFIQLFILIIITGLSIDINQKYVQGIQLFSFNKILLPFSNLQINYRQGEMLLQENNVLMAGKNVIPNKLLENQYYSKTIPENILGSHIQALAYTNANTTQNQDMLDAEEDVTVDVKEEINQSELDSATMERFKKSQIFLYCTHSAESYIPNSGQARLDGKRGLINQVAATVEQSLNSKGLPTEFVDTIHDLDYNTSYTKSRATVSKIVAANKNIIGLFDIHRDSIPGESKGTTVNVKGKKAARILIVVGTNERKAHPNWEQNFKFAKQIYEQGEKMYPGLIKGVVTKAGTYNQEYHPRALLLEFGSDTNTLAEVTLSAQCFADILIEVSKEVK